MKNFLVALILAFPLQGMPQYSFPQCCPCSFKPIHDSIDDPTDIWFAGDLNALKRETPVCFEKLTGYVEDLVEQLRQIYPRFTFVAVENCIVVSKKPRGSNPPPVERDTIARITVRGLVRDTRGKPIDAASIMIKGTKKGAVSDSSGLFTIRAPDGSTLVISHTSHYTEEIKAQEDKQLLIKLEPRNSELGELTTSSTSFLNKRSHTGSSVILGKNFSFSTNVMDLVKAKTAGFFVTPTSGAPGSSYNINIRLPPSLGTIPGVGANANPLFVIDGVPISSVNVLNQIPSIAGDPTQAGSLSSGLNALYFLNGADIETITVLKDPVTTSLYGPRGANGVIEITTKKPAPGKIAWNFAWSAGFGKVKILPVMSKEEYNRYRFTAISNDGNTPGPQNAADLFLLDSNRNINYPKFLAGRYAYSTDQQIAGSGGSSKQYFNFSLTHHRENSVTEADVYAQRHTGMFGYKIHLTHNLKAGLTVYYSDNKLRLVPNDYMKGILTIPQVPVADSAGRLAWEENTVKFINPRAAGLRTINVNAQNLLSRLSLEFEIIDRLVMLGSVGYQFVNTKEFAIYPIAAKNPAGNPVGEASWAANRFSTFNPQVELRFSHAKNNFRCRYDLGLSFYDHLNRRSLQSYTDYTDDSQLKNPAAGRNVDDRVGGFSYLQSSAFLRVQTAWLNRLFTSVVVRHDGSSRFPSHLRLNYYYSGGLAYIIVDPDIDKKKNRWLNFAKAKISFGTSGNDQIADYLYMDLYSVNVRDRQTSTSMPAWLQTDISPELTKKFEVGVEMNFFDNLFTVDANYYLHRTSNQLIRQLLPDQTGYGSRHANDEVTMQNSGLEFLFGSNFLWNHFEFKSNTSVSVPDRKLKGFRGLNNSAYAQTLVLNESPSVQKGLPYAGVDPATGMYAVSSAGKIIAGDLDPRIVVTMYHSVSWKNKVQFEVLLEGRAQKAPDPVALLLQYNVPGVAIAPNFVNMLPQILNHWQHPGDRTPYHKPSANPASAVNRSISNYTNSTANSTDGSFIRCKSMRFSFNIYESQKGLEKKRLSFFVHAENLFTISSYRITDPETIHPYVVPPLKTYRAGFQLSL